VFENSVLRRIFGGKKAEVARGWKQMYNEELYSLYSLPHTIWEIKSRRMRCMGQAAIEAMERSAVDGGDDGAEGCSSHLLLYSSPTAVAHVNQPKMFVASKGHHNQHLS
jgi:hypothetical protein